MNTCVSEDGIDTSVGKGEGVPVPVRELAMCRWSMLQTGPCFLVVME
jgi:hypothetical protein